MGKKYNFRIDQADLDSNRIESHQDFDALLQQFHAQQETKPQSKIFSLNPFKNNSQNRILWGSLIAAAASVAILLIVNPFKSTLSTEDLLAQESNYFDQQAFVKAPIPSAEPTFYKQQIQAETGGDVAVNAGLKLVVPEFAFMNDRGQQIQGEVDLEIREMHDPMDFFLTGIPMQYDSAGQRYQLESAGMVEIYGFQNGLPVQLAPGKTITVELISKVKFTRNEAFPKFNVYYLDTVQRNWEYTSIDLAQWVKEDAGQEGDEQENPFTAKLAELDQLAQTLIEDFKAVTAPPQKPSRTFDFAEDAPSLSLDFLQDSDLSLDTKTKAILDDNPTGVWWIAKNQNYDPRAFEVEWESAKLSEKGENTVQLTLAQGDASFSLLLHPVILGEELEKAKSNYDQAMAKYNEAYAAWEASQQEKIQAINDSITTLKSTYQTNQEESSISEDKLLKGAILSTFEIQKFGIWNCDRIVEKGTPAIIKQFEDQNGTSYNDHTGYLIDAQHNTLYKFYVGEQSLIPSNKTEGLKIWVLTKQEKIALLEEQGWQKEPKDKAVDLLKLELKDILLSSEEEVREILD